MKVTTTDRTSEILSHHRLVRATRICGNIPSPTRKHPMGCCREERFNVFTPPMKRRVGSGMLIARETIVGFYRGMRDSSATPYRTSRATLSHFKAYVYARRGLRLPVFLRIVFCSFAIANTDQTVSRNSSWR